ncbi:MAG: hypothetical protein ACD_54C01026G0002 [uncultured bacterium]|nr:MAG: hypothetical protein ACD_54C01026G0002 [uncultured bacterium]
MHLIFRHALDVEDPAVIDLQQEQRITVDLVFRGYLELGHDIKLMLLRPFARIQAYLNLNIRLHFARRQPLLGHHVFK